MIILLFVYILENTFLYRWVKILKLRTTKLWDIVEYIGKKLFLKINCHFEIISGQQNRPVYYKLMANSTKLRLLIYNIFNLNEYSESVS